MDAAKKSRFASRFFLKILINHIKKIMCSSPIRGKRGSCDSLVSLEKPLKRPRVLTMDLDVIHKCLSQVHCAGCERALSANLFPYKLSQISLGAENSAFIFDARYLDDVFIANSPYAEAANFLSF